jgi:hypothetical protein
MGKHFAAAAKLRFKQRLALAAPEFQPTRVPVAFAWPGGESAYVWSAASAHCLISLVNSPKAPAGFCVEVGWSTLRRFPEVASRPSVPANVAIPRGPLAGDVICNLSSISSAPALWQVPAIPAASDIEQYLASLAPMSPHEAQALADRYVNEAFEYIEQEGLPFLRAIADCSAI